MANFLDIHILFHELVETVLDMWSLQYNIDNNQYGYKIIKSFINFQKQEAK